MNRNSFMIKGWSITLTSALFALAATDASASFVAVAYFPCLMFWGLDAFFLRQERLFRALYDSVRTDEAQDSFTMNTDPFTGQVDSWFRVAGSKTLLAFPIA